MNQDERLKELDRMLAGDGVTVREAAQQLGVCRKTIHRDLDRLHKLGVKLSYDENWGWSSDKPLFSENLVSQ